MRFNEKLSSFLLCFTGLIGAIIKILVRLDCSIQIPVWEYMKSEHILKRFRKHS